MACGLPIVSSNKCVSALELMENNVGGLIFQSENKLDLKNKIETLLNDNKLCRKFISNNLIKIKDYTYDVMFNQQLSHIKDLKIKGLN
jgi:glycosyltransferase involved in cell wall biosynthesis